MELLKLQEEMERLKMIMRSSETVEFWWQVSEARYPQVKNVGQKPLLMFGSTYCCEALFSTMKVVRSKNCPIITDNI